MDNSLNIHLVYVCGTSFTLNLFRIKNSPTEHKQINCGHSFWIVHQPLRMEPCSSLAWPPVGEGVSHLYDDLSAASRKLAVHQIEDSAEVGLSETSSATTEPATEVGLSETSSAMTEPVAVSSSPLISRMTLNDNKAGMEGLDKDRINKIIHDASKGIIM